MNKLVMPKHAADISEIIPALEIYEDKGNWVTNSELKKNLKEIIGDDQYSSSYTKKASMLAYFGFIEWEEPNNSHSRKRITPIGSELLGSIKNESHDDICEVILTAIEDTLFGRKNCGVSDSNSYVEPPIVFLKAAITLQYLTYSEFALILLLLHDKKISYDNTIKYIHEFRNLDGKIYELGLDITEDDLKAKRKYSDAKPILFLHNLGFIDRGNDIPYKFFLAKDFIRKYEDRINELSVFNSYHISEKAFSAAGNKSETFAEDIPDKELLDVKYEEIEYIEVQPPKLRRKKKVKLSRKPTKKDFVGSYIDNKNVGEMGERMVLEIEKQRLQSYGLDDYIDKIEWSSNIHGDGLGYDIKSFNQYNDIVEEIFIEVKSSAKNRNDFFYVSRNEIEVSKEFKDHYFIYRLYNVNKTAQKVEYYIRCGSIDENFALEPSSFWAFAK